MADDPRRGDAPGRAAAPAGGPVAALQDASRGDGSGPKRPSGPSFPGWRVTRPNGGGQQPGNPPPTSSRGLVIMLVLGLLVVNFVISYEAQQPAARVQVPY